VIAPEISPARVEILDADRYPRAGARVDRPAGRGAAGPEISAEPEPDTAEPIKSGPPRGGDGRFRGAPLAKKAARIRELSWSDLAAAPTPRAGVAAGSDYVRRVVALAEQAGLDDPAVIAVVGEAAEAAVRAQMAAGDAAVAALETWRPVR